MNASGALPPRVVERLGEHRRPHGAWCQGADSERGNVIAAAQALRVLRWARMPLGQPAVRETLAYLARESLRHAAQVADGGRGEYARYVTFALEGLVELREAVGVRGVEEAVDRHVAWLLERQTPGGWAEAPGLEPSAFATARAVAALRRAGAPVRAIREGSSALLDMRHSRGYWLIERGDVGPSPALTALSIRALSGLSADADQRLQEAGAWLEGTQRRWLRQVEVEELPGAVWQHPSYALALGALARLGRCRASMVRASLELLAELWLPEESGWRLLGDRHRTMKGVWAAVVCLEAIGDAAWPDHAALAAGASRERAVAGDGDEDWTIVLAKRPHVRVASERSVAVLTLRPRQWDLLSAFSESVRTPREELSRKALGQRLGLVGSGSLSKELTRLHEALAAGTGGRLRTVVVASRPGWLRLTLTIETADA